MSDKEQLLTELTPEEGAIIEGGARLVLYNAFAIRAGADSGRGNGDDVYIKVNGRKILGTRGDVDGGEVVNINRVISFNNTASISLVDEDAWPNPDDSLGSFTVDNTPTDSIRIRRVSGSGSIYDVIYKVLA